MKRAKIVATVGPATDPEGVLEEVLREGADVLRFNFSHGSREEQKARLERARKAAEKAGARPAMMLDTKGPEIRIRTFADGPVELEAGDMFVLACDEAEGTKERVSVTYADLWREVSHKDVVLLDDGMIAMTVESIEGKDIVCKISNGGTLSNNKSINIPGSRINLPSLSERDVDDIRFAIDNGFDYIAASFIRSPEDVFAIKGILSAYGGEIPVIAKIENRMGVDNAEAILAVCDGILVGRGDLGVELPPEEVPVVQKKLIRLCNEAGKPVVTATQMLDSMIRNPRPTRAEVADVANAVLDGSDAVMLSGETAAGKYPVLSVQTMRRAIEMAESLAADAPPKAQAPHGKASAVDAIAYVSCHAAFLCDARIILTLTSTGYTPRMIARFRPDASIVAVTATEKVARRLALIWGVESLVLGKEAELRAFLSEAASQLAKRGRLKPDDMVVIAAGLKMNIAGATNTLRIEKASDLY
jgi:pyruvate kinase